MTTWRIKRIKPSYKLCHNSVYIFPSDRIVGLWRQACSNLLNVDTPLSWQWAIALTVEFLRAMTCRLGAQRYRFPSRLLRLF